VDEKAIRRAALITLRRAICERFPPGRGRLQWLARIFIARKKNAARRRRQFGADFNVTLHAPSAFSDAS